MILLPFERRQITRLPCPRRLPGRGSPQQTSAASVGFSLKAEIRNPTPLLPSQQVAKLPVMLTTQPSKLVIVAWVSVAVSLGLGVTPFFSPELPIGLILLANWMLFMAVGYLACPKPFRFAPPFQKMDVAAFKIWRIVLIAFTAAGWLAIMAGQPVL